MDALSSPAGQFIRAPDASVPPLPPLPTDAGQTGGRAAGLISACARASDDVAANRSCRRSVCIFRLSSAHTFAGQLSDQVTLWVVLNLGRRNEKIAQRPVELGQARTRRRHTSRAMSASERLSRQAVSTGEPTKVGKQTNRRTDGRELSERASAQAGGSTIEFLPYHNYINQSAVRRPQ